MDNMTKNTEKDDNNRQGFKQFWNKFKESVVFKIARFITNSAAIALLITAILFVYQEHEERERSERIISNLQDISEDMLTVQKSISTRYLGIFPSYIQVVNELFRTSSPKDTIIIFEDVLYYGFLSRPEEFVQMNRQLLSHADNGGSVIIVYYDEEGQTFHRMIREEWISPSLYAAMEREGDSAGQDKSLDSLLCNKYFALSRDENISSFEARITRDTESLLYPLCEDDGSLPDLANLCARIDSVRVRCIGGKPMTEIGFFDYETMDRSITKEIAAVYRAHGIEMLPLDEYFTMCCWLAGERAVLAFPSKWSSDEIGFFSQDPAFARYITAMLVGVRSSIIP